MSTDLLTIVNGSHLAPASAAKLLEVFQPAYNRIRELTEQTANLVVTDVSQTAEMEIARVTRIALKNIRTASDKERKAIGEEHLRASQAINKVAKVIWTMAETEEARLLEQEMFAERAEEQRKLELADARVNELVALDAHPSIYRIGDMTEEQFRELIAGIKAQKEAALIAQMQAEEEAAAKAEEDARIRAENNRLKQEAAQREAAVRHERERLEAVARAERNALDAKALAERRIAEDKANQLAEQARRERERAAEALRVEREARERLEADKAAQEAAQAEKARSEAEAARKAAQAPDAVKIRAFAEAVELLPKPQCSTEMGQLAVHEIEFKVEELLAAIHKLADQL